MAIGSASVPMSDYVKNLGVTLNFCTLWVQHLTPLGICNAVSPNFVWPWKVSAWKKTPYEGGCPRQVWNLLIGLGTPRLTHDGQYISGFLLVSCTFCNSHLNWNHGGIYIFPLCQRLVDTVDCTWTSSRFVHQTTGDSGHYGGQPVVLPVFR